MVYAAWILFLLLLTVFFNNYLEQQYNPNSDIHIAQDSNEEITLLRNRYGHYVTSGRINGQKVTFLLDTGATTISIPQNIAQRIGLSAGTPIQVSTANGTITVYNTVLDSVSIGPITLHQLRAGINPYMDGEEILLGMNFLKHLELTQRGKQLIIRNIASP